MSKENREKVAIHNKINLTLEEASEISNIGICTLRDIVRENADLDFVCYVGKKLLFHRETFDKWCSEQYIIR